jgi:hypothetical protein
LTNIFALKSHTLASYRKRLVVELSPDRSNLSTASGGKLSRRDRPSSKVERKKPQRFVVANQDGTLLQRHTDDRNVIVARTVTQFLVFAMVD